MELLDSGREMLSRRPLIKGRRLGARLATRPIFAIGARQRILSCHALLAYTVHPISLLLHG